MLINSLKQGGVGCLVFFSSSLAAVERTPMLELILGFCSLLYLALQRCELVSESFDRPLGTGPGACRFSR